MDLLSSNNIQPGRLTPPGCPSAPATLGLDPTDQVKVAQSKSRTSRAKEMGRAGENLRGHELPSSLLARELIHAAHGQKGAHLAATRVLVFGCTSPGLAWLWYSWYTPAGKRRHLNNPGAVGCLQSHCCPGTTLLPQGTAMTPAGRGGYPRSLHCCCPAPWSRPTKHRPEGSRQVPFPGS